MPWGIHLSYHKLHLDTQMSFYFKEQALWLNFYLAILPLFFYANEDFSLATTIFNIMIAFSNHI